VPLAGAALGGVLSLLWLRRRALPAALAAALAVAVFVAVAAAGLSINTRYGFLTAALLCVFCGAGVSGWTRLPHGHSGRRWWALAGTALLIALAVATPRQIGAADRELDKLSRQQDIKDDLVALVDDHAVNLRCGPVGVPNHAPVPLLALYLRTSPRKVIDLQTQQILRGVYVDPASTEVEHEFLLDPRDPHVPVGVPPGFHAVRANHSWLIFARCA
jgi:hypothetical protein